jgi:cytochrome c peroxidase
VIELTLVSLPVALSQLKSKAVRWSLLLCALGGCGSTPHNAAKDDAGRTTGDDAGRMMSKDAGRTGPQAGSGGMSAEAMEALRELSPDELPAPPPDITNRFADDPAAAAFGHKLFFDPGFSGALLDSDNDMDTRSLGKTGESGKVACTGCHVPQASFLDSRSTRAQVSLAAGWGRRRTRHLLDVGQAKVIMWDGRHDALWNQPLLPLETAFEMNSSRLYAAEQIYERHRAQYEAIFGPIPVPLDNATRFPQLDGSTTGCRSLSGLNTGVDCHGMPGDKAEFDGLSAEDQDEVTRVVMNMGKALGAYERLFSCGQSRFDAWMHGQTDALSESEQRGAALFVGQRADGTMQTGCNSCHSGPFFTDQRFHNVGMAPVGVGPAGSFLDRDDHGALEGLTAVLADPTNTRGKFSDGDDGRLPDSIPKDADGAFRTPSLRCASRRPTFMHTGQFLSLEDALKFFDRGGQQVGFPGINELTPFGFTQSEREDLAAFIRALDGTGPDPELTAAPK